jgi:DNA-binding transcriptional LysR family regulator
MSRAGEQANIVGSAISKRLAQLEHQLRTPLLVRRRHGVVPTAAGQTLLEHAREMLNGAARIERDMEGYVSGAHGKVRVLANVSALAESLAHDVAAFLKQPAHGTIRIDLEERLNPEVVRGVREGLASLGVCWDVIELGSLQCRPYRTDHLCVVTPRGHPLAAYGSVRFEQTLDYEQVNLPVNSALQVTVQREASRLGRTLVNRIVVGNFETALRVVDAGLGISLVPREIAEVRAALYGLHVIPLAEPWAERRFVLCFRDMDALSLAARRLVEHLTGTGRP